MLNSQKCTEHTMSCTHTHAHTTHTHTQPPTSDSQDNITFKIDGVCQTESSTDPSPPNPPDKTDGLVSSISADDVHNQQRLSIFSTGSSVASSISFQDELQEPAIGEDDYVAATLPRTSPRQFRSRRFSVDTTNQKKNIGVNHFNR